MSKITEFQKMVAENDYFTELQNKQIDWENRLDDMGAFPDFKALAEHFEKAPMGAPSLPAVVEYLQTAKA